MLDDWIAENKNNVVTLCNKANNINYSIHVTHSFHFFDTRILSCYRLFYDRPNRQTMKIKTVIFFYILTILTSCNGQTTNRKPNPDLSENGDTVKELGSNIMVVYQDKKKVYWFGSWETGVYRYDGKTLINYTSKNGLKNNRIDEIKEDKLGNIYFNNGG